MVPGGYTCVLGQIPSPAPAPGPDSVLPAHGGEENEGKDGGEEGERQGRERGVWPTRANMVTGPKVWAHILALPDYRLCDTEDKPPSPPRLLSSSAKPG